MSDTEARATPELRVVESEPTPAPTPTPVAPPVTQALIDAVTQLEANKKDVSPRGFQKRLQLAYASPSSRVRPGCWRMRAPRPGGV